MSIKIALINEEGIDVHVWHSNCQLLQQILLLKLH